MIAAGSMSRLAAERGEAAEVAKRALRQEANQRALAETARHLAEANFAKARAAVDESFTKISESQLLTVPGMQPLRRELLSSALRFYEDFVKEHHDDSTVPPAWPSPSCGSARSAASWASYRRRRNSSRRPEPRSSRSSSRTRRIPSCRTAWPSRSCGSIALTRRSRSGDAWWSLVRPSFSVNSPLRTIMQARSESSAWSNDWRSLVTPGFSVNSPMRTIMQALSGSSGWWNDWTCYRNPCRSARCLSRSIRTIPSRTASWATLSTTSAASFKGWARPSRRWRFIDGPSGSTRSPSPGRHTTG